MNANRISKQDVLGTFGTAIRYTVVYDQQGIDDAADCPEPFAVYDGDMDEVSRFRCEVDAVEYARELAKEADEEADEEARQERCQGWRDAIGERLDDCDDEDLLKAVLVALKG